MTETADAVVRAWTDEGPYPPDHRAAQDALRKGWPTLANALDALAAERAGQLRFKRGDRVVVVASTSRWHGMTGIVLEVLPERHSFDYAVSSDETGNDYPFNDDELQAVPRMWGRGLR